MKKTTCLNLRGACDAEITGNSPEEIGERSKKHVMEMVQKGDVEHVAAMESMKKMPPEEQQKWYEDFKNRFETLPEA